MPWYTGILLWADMFMTSWHKSQEEARRLRGVNRAGIALLVNDNILPSLTSTYTLFSHERV